MTANKETNPNKIINEFCKKIVLTNYRCQHCMYSHPDGTCFFAFKCMTTGFSLSEEED